MAKKSAIEKNKRRMKLVKRFAAKRTALRAVDGGMAGAFQWGHLDQASILTDRAAAGPMATGGAA